MTRSPGEGWVEADDYRGPERRREVHITPAQIDLIAQKAAEQAVAKMIDQGYKAVGKTVIERGTWVIGALAMAMIGFAASRGWIKIG